MFVVPVSESEARAPLQGGREGGGGGETADVDSISCFRVEDRGEERLSSGVEWNGVEWREPKGQVDTD